MALLRAAALYFGLTFGAGFMLGPIRTLLLEPNLGPFFATLLEAPLMLVAMTAIAIWILRQYDLHTAPARLAMGGLAFVFLMIIEMLGALLMYGQGPGEYATSLATPEGILRFALFVFFGLLPWLLLHVKAVRQP
ncbi:MAG: hypothetical protein GC184_00560 [Rhizobiales bacterium]|nr:hypothetical protein [Hyphomicrobiales bacterium]